MRRLTKMLYKRWNTYNPFEVAECMGVDFRYVELNEKMLGLTVVFERKPIILINSCLVDSNKRFEVMAHELSHALCHIDLPLTYGFTVNGRMKLESEADDFAAHLLMGLFVQEFGETPKSFREMQSAFMLDDDAMDYYIGCNNCVTITINELQKEGVV